MNYNNIEQFIKQKLGTTGFEVEFAFNDHKSGYKSLAKELHSALPNRQYVFISNRQKKQAVRYNTLWRVSIRKCINKGNREYISFCGRDVKLVVEHLFKCVLPKKCVSDLRRMERVLLKRLHGEQTTAYFSFNEWVVNYQSVKENLDDYSGLSNACGDWLNEDDKEIAIQTNCIWTAQWYPYTSISFYNVNSPSLEELINYMVNFEENN